MAGYLFIESRDPWDSGDCARFAELVRGVRERNHDTTLFLVQNGVLAARTGAEHGVRLTELARAGVTVLADAFALRERAIDELIEGVKPAPIGQLVELALEPGRKTLWH